MAPVHPGLGAAEENPAPDATGIEAIVFVMTRLENIRSRK